MIKQLSILLISILLISSVSALSSSTFSLRASGNEDNIQNIGQFTSFSSSNIKIKFSSLHSNSKSSGKGSITLQGKTSEGLRIVLNLKIIETNTTTLSGNRIIIENNAKGRYSIGGARENIVIEKLVYDYKYNESSLSIYSDENASFSINLNNLQVDPKISQRYFRVD